MGLAKLFSKVLSLVLLAGNVLASSQAIEGKITSSSSVKVMSSSLIKGMLPKGLKLSHQSITPADSHPVIIVSRTMKDVRELGFTVALGERQQKTLLIIPYVEEASSKRIVSYSIELKSTSILLNHLNESTVSEVEMIDLLGLDNSRLVAGASGGLVCKVMQLGAKAHFVEKTEEVTSCL